MYGLSSLPPPNKLQSLDCAPMKNCSFVSHPPQEHALRRCGPTSPVVSSRAAGRSGSDMERQSKTSHGLVKLVSHECSRPSCTPMHARVMHHAHTARIDEPRTHRVMHTSTCVRLCRCSKGCIPLATYTRLPPIPLVQIIVALAHTRTRTLRTRLRTRPLPSWTSGCAQLDAKAPTIASRTHHAVESASIAIACLHLRH